MLLLAAVLPWFFMASSRVSNGLLVTSFTLILILTFVHVMPVKLKKKRKYMYLKYYKQVACNTLRNQCYKYLKKKNVCNITVIETVEDVGIDL